MYVDKATLERAVNQIYGTAGHFLKIWLILKHMGLSSDSSWIQIDTANSTPSLKRLFSCGDPNGRFYIPFAHTPRYLTIQKDAARSVVQTNIQRWATSGSVVTCDPTEFLDCISVGEALQVRAGRNYPMGLGIGESGFALNDNSRVSMPLTAFAVWYGRQVDIPTGADASRFLTGEMLKELHISETEKALIFVDDIFSVATSQKQLTDEELFAICRPFIDNEEAPTAKIYTETKTQYARRVRSMTSNLNLPQWMRTPPEKELTDLLDAKTKAILLYGPPRTGKTRIIDATIKRDSATRCTIQIHDGWGYDNLMEGFRPDENGKWSWTDGPLKVAVESGKKFIVLEEINRTSLSQALGEVFSLIEDAYRGKAMSIVLRSGKSFFIPDDVVFLMTMNTLDKSTEEVDDALLGRIASVSFPPRTEDLSEMLTQSGVPEETRGKLTNLFAEILSVYPLGHGYFANLKGNVSNPAILNYYKARIRPVTENFLGTLKRQDLGKIDNLVDELFGK